MDYSQRIEELHLTIQNFFEAQESSFTKIVEEICLRLRQEKKILVFGNGGSAAQAQHFAAELVNRYLSDRAPIAAISLTTDTSALTSIANDSAFDDVFSRQLEALSSKGDIALGLSTSGNSPNVIKAIERAKECGLMTVVLTGEGGGRIGQIAEYCCDVPSTKTPLIQEVHLLWLHLLAEDIEKRLSTSELD
ncbi:SIS domain-containing protein [Acidobacteriota bacterium]